MLTGKLTENNNFRFSGTNAEQNPIRTIAISRSTTLKENTTSVPRPTIGEFLGVPNGDGDCDDCTWANCQESAPCVFPTTYQGESYYECIFIDNDGYPWCNITGGGWGNCDKSTCKIDYDTRKYRLMYTRGITRVSLEAK